MNRRLSGKKAYTSGILFETFFEGMCAIQSIKVVPIPDGCKQTSRGLIRVRTPFDYLLSYKGKAGFIDTKSTLSESFSYSMIDQDQVDNLLLLKDCGVSGYVIKLREEIYFVHVDILLGVEKRSSIDFSQCVHLGNRGNCDFRKVFI